MHTKATLGTRSHAQSEEIQLFPDTTEYVSHVLRPGHLELVGPSADGVAKLEDLTTPTKLRYLLDLSKVFCRFLPNFALQVGSFHKTVRKDQLKTFGLLDVENSDIVRSLEVAFVRTPVLALPSRKDRYVFAIDACGKIFECVLLQ